MSVGRVAGRLASTGHPVYIYTNGKGKRPAHTEENTMDTTPNTVAAAHREPNALYETPGIDLFGTNENGEADTNHLEWIDYAGSHEQWDEQNPTHVAEAMLAARGYRVTGEWTDCYDYYTATIEAL